MSVRATELARLALIGFLFRQIQRVNRSEITIGRHVEINLFRLSRNLDQVSEDEN